MNTATITRRQTSFRLREDLLEALKERAGMANRTLNNYVESVLLFNVSETPNKTTLAAMQEVQRDKKNSQKESYASAKEMLKAIL